MNIRHCKTLESLSKCNTKKVAVENVSFLNVKRRANMMGRCPNSKQGGKTPVVLKLGGVL